MTVTVGPLINPEELGRVFADCMHRDDEPTDDAVICEGVTCTVGFHPGRLLANADKIHGWLDALPDQFHADKGGGWSFLNACNDRNDVQWTGLHLRVQELMQLGIGLGRVGYCVPRDFWPSLPGGVPYFLIRART
jgi:hypothetical protein